LATVRWAQRSRTFEGLAKVVLTVAGVSARLKNATT
jgi:hypothetical protein